MNNPEQRLRLVEDQMTVLAREFSEVMAENQRVIMALAQTLKIGLGTMHDRLETLETAAKRSYDRLTELEEWQKSRTPLSDTEKKKLIDETFTEAGFDLPGKEL